MRALTAPDLLEVWETARGQTQPQRTLTVLGAAEPGLTAGQLARLPLGQRDQLLLELHELCFGPRLEGCAECPGCREQLEVALMTDVLLARAARERPPGAVYTLKVGDHRLRFRLPTTEDLQIAASESSDVTTARAAILARCVIEVSRRKHKVEVRRLPERVLGRVAARMVECDPLAESLLDLRCPSCAHQWQLSLDIMAFIWNGIVERAERLLREVHVLASAYGWSEADILSLSSARRQFYMEAVS